MQNAVYEDAWSGEALVTSTALRPPAPATPAELAVRISNRHTGVGGDGLVLIGPSKRADARMRMFNADGSESEMCGNAIRCVAKYLSDHGIVRKPEMTIETGTAC